MKIVYLIILFSSITKFGLTQNTINEPLKRELESILSTDQGVREYIVGNPGERRKDSLAALLKIPKDSLDLNPWGCMANIDKINLAKVEKIITQYGYPGKSLVGEPANTAVFFVIQHSPKIEKYFPLIENAAKTKELPFEYYALMLDRKLALAGKEQIYGTQIFTKSITDSVTGTKKKFSYVVPIKDPARVNKLRKEAGFNQTVEENAKRLGVIYKPYTYEQIRKITGSDK